MDELKLFAVGVTWKMQGTLFIRAKSIVDAMDEAYEADLPDGDYVDDSFSVDHNAASETKEENWMKNFIIKVDYTDES